MKIEKIITGPQLAALDEAGFALTKLTSVGRMDYPRLGWWKMHALAWCLRVAELNKSPQNEILLAVARKSNDGQDCR